MTASDGTSGTYSYLGAATTPDAGNGPGADIQAPGPNSLYAQELTPAEIIKLAARLPANLAVVIVGQLSALI